MADEMRPAGLRVDVGFSVDETTPVFVISVAAQLAGMHPQTLRQYDRLGLVSPRRTELVVWRPWAVGGESDAADAEAQE